MSDYIKRSDALRPFVFAPDGTKYLLHDCDNFPVQINLKDVQRTLRKIPAADVVEVVRCKDCKHRILNKRYGERGYMNIKAACDLDTGDPY